MTEHGCKGEDADLSVAAATGDTGSVDTVRGSTNSFTRAGVTDAAVAVAVVMFEADAFRRVRPRRVVACLSRPLLLPPSMLAAE